jgi:pyruvate carboxylase
LTAIPIKKILVANRGEIAIRVFRAASELHISTVAIYTYEDRYSLHRYKADEAYQVGDDNEPLKPYLDIDKIISIACENGVDAIHPGYGFLSENENFAQACINAGIRWIGPSPDVMNALGDKISAKKVASKAGVPIVPASEGEITDMETLKSTAEKIGFPVMIKAAYGGGGRGMRVVHNSNDLTKAFKEASGEAKTAFGNASVFVEKYIADPKHIEVQLLGDEHGNLVHLYERDCSIQRRFQKVVEIAPASSLNQKTRDKLCEYAYAIGKQVNYQNAGTVEFLLDEDENIFFIEVNTRIQVEHTVTEVITGIDIVRNQILIAAGLKLSNPQIGLGSQEDIQYRGVALQCRITTEDPSKDFKPDYGRLVAYRSASGFGIRLDAGNAYAGATISPFFDSMLVKVTASGNSLEDAADRMHRALREFRIRGVKSNISFLLNILREPNFRAGKTTVHYISNHPELLEPPNWKDRGTKIIRYIGEINVNGHPDVKNVQKDIQFNKFQVPKSNRDDFLPGTKQLLDKLGPDGFTAWVKNNDKILFTDTTFRDAHQSLLATRVRTFDMLQVAESFAKDHGHNLFSMEVWGGATFDVAMRFLKECPWDRLASFRKAIPNTLLQMLLRGSNGVGYKAYPDNLIEEFVEKSAETGIDVFRVFDSMNWVEAMKVSINTIRRKTKSIAEVSICYSGDVLDTNGKYNIQYYKDLASEIEDAGAHIIAIKDMAGLLKPLAAEYLITELKNHISLPIHLHTHDTSSIQSATYLRAIEAGVDVVDVALSALSGLTSQPNFNSVVAMIGDHKRTGSLDLNSLNKYSNYWEEVRKYYYPFETELKAGTAEVYDHEIPGGQYSNLRPQARSLGLEDKFDTIKKNYADINKMMGGMIKVTPSSKVVGDLAMFMTANDLSIEDVKEKGASLDFPDSVISLMKGELGQRAEGWPKDFQNAVLKNTKAFTDRPNAHLAPIDFDVEFAAFQTRFPEKNSFLDFLSYSLYPKVFEDYHEHILKFGDTSILPTHCYFYGLMPNNEIKVRIAKGKNILIEYMNTNAPNPDGSRLVVFRTNGSVRSVMVKDNNVKSQIEIHKKANGIGQIGSPLQGSLSKVLVSENDSIKKNDPLFIIEAMKMESTITAPFDAKVLKIHLKDRTLVKQEDLIIELQQE